MHRSQCDYFSFYIDLRVGVKLEFYCPFSNHYLLPVITETLKKCNFTGKNKLFVLISLVGYTTSYENLFLYFLLLVETIRSKVQQLETGISSMEKEKKNIEGTSDEIILSGESKYCHTTNTFSGYSGRSARG